MILLLQAGLAIAIKILFFAHGSPALSNAGGSASSPESSPPADEGDAARFMFR